MPVTRLVVFLFFVFLFGMVAALLVGCDRGTPLLKSWPEPSIGMSCREAAALLGEPSSIENDNGEMHFFYHGVVAGHAFLSFTNGKLDYYSITQPNGEEVLNAWGRRETKRHLTLEEALAKCEKEKP